MATNPIQRRSRQSFLLGFFIALLVMAAVVGVLYVKINSLNGELEKAKANMPKTAMVLQTMEEIKSGDLINQDNFLEKFMVKEIRTDADTSMYAGELYFQTDKEGNPLEKYELMSKIDIPIGANVLEGMFVKDGEEIPNDERMAEYNYILLPSQLKNGDYVDIRFTLPNGNDYLVLSKKYVEQTDAESMWIKVTEAELMTLESVTVDAYITPGSKLYAIPYTDPGMQERLVPTYSVSGNVSDLIRNDPNIIYEAAAEMGLRYNGDVRGEIDAPTYELFEEQKAATVQSAVTESAGRRKALRSEFVTSLEGTGLVGKTDY